MKNPGIRSFVVLCAWTLLATGACERSAPPPPVDAAPKKTAPSSTEPQKPAPPTTTTSAAAPTHDAKTEEPARNPSAQPATKPIDRARGIGDNILLITLDTTRADYLGCYGRKEAATPAMDALAQRGTLFERAFCQVPITLPSHASILTGKYPRQHGIFDNGRERLSEDQVTLAHLARAQGYKTGAFVASYVLDSRFGLAHAFDEYNDDMGVRDRTTDPLHWEQPANVVTDRALAWLSTVQAEPFFCWVHYYDPHDPYAPPEAFKNVGKNPYDGEIAFVDSQIARLVTWLSETKLDDRTLIVVVADHGESFGEHREVGHTIFLYDTNIHVPLIVVGPRGIQAGQRVDTVVETVDLFPTIAELVGWKLPANLGLQSRSLVPALRGDPLEPGAAYSESLYALHTYGWCEQRSLTTAKWKYISTIKPELFDREADPGELENLFDSKPDLAREMAESLRTRFEAMPIGKVESMGYDAQARRTLQSLGYAGGGGLTSDDFLTTTYPDPKDELEVVKILMVGRRALRDKQYQPALVHFYNAALRAPNSVIVQSGYGTALLNVYDEQAKQANGVGDFELLEKALDAFAKTLELDSMNELAMVSIGDVLVRQRRYDQALEQYRRVLEGRTEYPEIHVKIAIALRESGHADQARMEYERALALDPTLADAHYDLGVYYLERNDPNQALPHLHEAVRFEPKERNYRYNLGLALYQLEHYEAAVEQFKIAVELDENFKNGIINLGIAQFQAGQVGEAQATLIRASQDPRMAPEAFYNLGVVLEQQDRPQMALGFYHQSFELKPDFVPTVTRLVRWYLDESKHDRVAEILRKAVAARPDDVAMLNTLAALLATSRDDGVRVGSEAVTLAERASAITGHAHPDVLRTLATAYAETGEFDKAVSTAEKALQLARSAGRIPFAELLEADLTAYRNKQPIRTDRF